MSKCSECSQSHDLEMILGELLAQCDALDNMNIRTREISLAQTKLEECVMWIKKQLED